MFVVAREDTVMDTLADGLQHLDVDGGSTAVVAIVLVFVIACDAMQAFGSSEGEGCPSRDARNDITRVKVEYGGVDVDGVWMQDAWEGERFQNGLGKVARERTLIRTVEVVILAGTQGDIVTDTIPGVPAGLGCGTMRDRLC